MAITAFETANNKNPPKRTIGCRLSRAPERHEKSEVQSGRRRGESGNGQKPAGPAMELEVSSADARRELEGRENEEESAGEDMEKRRGRVSGEPAVEERQLDGSLALEGVMSADEHEELPAERARPEWRSLPGRCLSQWMPRCR